MGNVENPQQLEANKQPSEFETWMKSLFEEKNDQAEKSDQSEKKNN